ncbi:hypothetical protein PRIPAC_83387 [Pristionchus pacificus]|uniref:Uncharacterized protein n=1 Tax=Pristionchus pacificus TaxID=54126 RepID=A0A2A6BTC0_PRIPA|nr:hypothetical protein PRIPAC_83387 [Pristionchus pacificus]|eukprot:PDM69011.1 hypothetical protein PRIPAC_47313 [Pristionchus pacificus]
MRKCYYATNSPGAHETEQRLKPFDLSQIPCISTFIDGRYDAGLFGCSSVLDLMNVRANGEPADNDNKDQLASRFICNDHFDSLITNWNGSDDKLKNRRQSRLKYDYSALKCPLSHQKPASAEERRVVDKMNAKAAKVPKTKGIHKNSTKSTRSKSSVRSTKEGTRKRVVVKESEDSDDAISEQDEFEDMGDIEDNEEHEDDFVRRVIQEDINELFLVNRVNNQ